MTEDVLEEKLRLSFPEALRDRAKKYIKPVLRFSAHHKIDPLWVLSIMWNESHFRSDALSGKGAKGLMQLISSTKEDVIKRYNGRGEAFFIEKDDFRIHDFFPGISSELVDKKRRALLNLEVAIIYLKELLDLFENDYRLATIAYNMGPTRIKMQVENKIPVGHNHRYLKKILHSYHYISKQLVHYDVVTKITR